MTPHALSRYFGKPGKYRLQIAGDACFLGSNSKPACRAVHRRPGILHSLWHVPGNFRSSVQPQRRHSQPFFRDFGSNVRMTHGEMELDFLQSLEMIAHVCQRVFDQWRRKFHELT